MRSLPTLLVVLLLFVAVAISAPTNDGSTDDQTDSTNVIQQVIKALAHRDDMKLVIEYLGKEEEYLNEKLPALDSGNSVINYLIIILYTIYIIIVDCIF